MKKFVLVLIVCTLLCVALVACSPKEDEPTAEQRYFLNLDRFAYVYGQAPISPADGFALTLAPEQGVFSDYLFQIWYSKEYVRQTSAPPLIELTTNTGLTFTYDTSWEYGHSSEYLPCNSLLAEVIVGGVFSIIPDTWIFVQINPEDMIGVTSVSARMFVRQTHGVEIKDTIFATYTIRI